MGRVFVWGGVGVVVGLVCLCGVVGGVECLCVLCRMGLSGICVRECVCVSVCV